MNEPVLSSKQGIRFLNGRISKEGSEFVARVDMLRGKSTVQVKKGFDTQEKAQDFVSKTKYGKLSEDDWKMVLPKWKWTRGI